MSYALKLVGSARTRLRALPVGVQEALLDLLETLAADEVSSGHVQLRKQHVLLYRDGARAFKVFIATYTDHPGRTLRVTSIWYIATV